MEDRRGAGRRPSMPIRLPSGKRLFAIEAMKMKTAVYAEVSGVVTEVVAPAGTRVEAHEQVIVLQPEE